MRRFSSMAAAEPVAFCQSTLQPASEDGETIVGIIDVHPPCKPNCPRLPGHRLPDQLEAIWNKRQFDKIVVTMFHIG